MHIILSLELIHEYAPVRSACAKKIINSLLLKRLDVSVCHKECVDYIGNPTESLTLLAQYVSRFENLAGTRRFLTL